jgi:4-amino-4-deoxy-L-arabinose transferase-like glycosyltransferase
MEISLSRQAAGAASRYHLDLATFAWPMCLFAVALLLRAAWTIYVDLSPVNDAHFYYHAADALASGEGFRNVRGELTKSMAPGYPLALASLFAAFGTHLVVGQTFNLLVAAAAAPITYFIGLRLRDRQTGIVAGSIMALFPSQVFFTSMLMTEPLFTTLAAALVLATLTWFIEPPEGRLWQWLAVGVLLGIMVLVRAEALMLLPALAVLLKVLGWNWRRTGVAASILLVSTLMIVSPWTVRNYVQFDEVVLVRGEEGDGDRLLRLGLSPDYDDWKYRHAGGTNEEPASWTRLRTYYMENPSEMAILAGDKLRALYGSEDPFFFMEDPRAVGNLTPNLALSSAEARAWGGLSDAFYYTVMLLALVGSPLWFCLRDKRQWVVLWFVASWSLIHLMFVPQERYHYPVLPMLSVLAALTLVTAWQRLALALPRPSKEEQAA